MSNFASLIKEESRAISELHAEIHRTVLKRNEDRESWRRACSNFHSYVPRFNRYLDNVYSQGSLNNQEAIEFSLAFLEVDPRFFRSGYIKERILTKIKRSKLTKKQLNRLKSVLINSVNGNPSREYKYYCRVAGFVADAEFEKSLMHIAEFSSDSRKGKALKMLRTIEQSRAHNKFRNENARKAGTDAA